MLYPFLPPLVRPSVFDFILLLCLCFLVLKVLTPLAPKAGSQYDVVMLNSH